MISLRCVTSALCLQLRCDAGFLFGRLFALAQMVLSTFHSCSSLLHQGLLHGFYQLWQKLHARDHCKHSHCCEIAADLHPDMQTFGNAFGGFTVLPRWDLICLQGTMNECIDRDSKAMPVHRRLYKM